MSENISLEKIASGGRLGVLVIMIISLCGFTAGLLKNNLSSQADEKNSIYANLEDQASALDSFVKYTVDGDISAVSLAWDNIRDAGVQIHEWIALHEPDVNVSADLLAAEDVKHEIQVLQLLEDSKETLETTTLFILYRHFVLENKTGNFVLADRNQGASFDYVISRQDWDRLNSGSFIIQSETPAVFLNNSVYPRNEIIASGGNTTFYDDVIFPEINGSLPPDFMFYKFNISNLFELYYGPVDNLRAVTNAAKQEAVEAETIADQVGVAVSITSVTVVLSTAMSQRLEKRKLMRMISVLRVDLTQEERHLVGEQDNLALIVLVVAAGLSIAGLVMSLPL